MIPWVILPYSFRMAAIVEDVAKFDLERFLDHLRAELPSYAIPLFVRLVTSLDITGGTAC